MAPVGISYQVLNGEKLLAAGRISDGNNEVSFDVSDDQTLNLRAKGKGDAVFKTVLRIPVKREDPVVVVRINTAKFQSKTHAHPLTDDSSKNLQQPIFPGPNSHPATLGVPPGEQQFDQGLQSIRTHNFKKQPEHQIVPGECACDKDLTIDQLAAIFPSRKKSDLEKFLTAINSMLSSYSINTCLRKSHALAQIGHESGSLRYLVEVLPKGKREADVYDGYMGRGLIQLTLKANYKKYGDFKGLDFLGNNKFKLETIEYATDSAGWFWVYGKGIDLNLEADRNDLLMVSARVNGGYNGLDDRIAIFKRSHKALLVPACKISANRSANYLPFESSKLYDEAGAVFGWAWWHDSSNKLTGVQKDGKVAEDYYARFLLLNNARPLKKPRFNFDSVAAMVKYATGKAQ